MASSYISLWTDRISFSPHWFQYDFYCLLLLFHRQNCCLHSNNLYFYLYFSYYFLSVYAAMFLPCFLNSKLSSFILEHLFYFKKFLHLFINLPLNTVLSALISFNKYYFNFCLFLNSFNFHCNFLNSRVT